MPDTRYFILSKLHPDTVTAIAVFGGGNPFQPTTPPMQRISDDSNARIEDLLNKAIHELVFAIANADDDDPEEALTCLTQAQFNLDACAEILQEANGRAVNLN